SSACLSLAVLATDAAAQNYPARPITIVVPFAPGGPTDSAARVVANALAKQTNATFIVENAPGAGATIGTTKVSQAAPDGYTLLWGSASIAITTHLYDNLQYDPVKSFSPIGLVGEQPYVLVINPKNGFQDVAQLIDFAK